MCDNNNNRLRCITYLSPSLPVEYFEGIIWYLERVLNREVQLVYESRWSGPPPTRIDPFTRNDVDLGFMCSYSFIRLLKEKDALVELLPCAAKHSHPMAVAEKVPVYYGDVVISKSQSEKIKKFDDLRGHTWAYNDSESLSGNIQVLKQLKSMGENASFFGHIVETGSHIKSLEMILNSTVDGACIDSNVLASYLMKNPSMKDKLHVIASLGPLPAYPVVINKNLPESLKVALRDALQRMHEDETGGPHLRRHGVSGFVPTDISLYDFETKIRQESSGLRIGTAYY